MVGAFEQALESALRYLARRDRFEAELRLHLGSYPDEIRDQVVDHLKRKQILDDRRTAEAHATHREGKRAVGKAALRQQLLDRGASEELTETIPANATDLQRALIVLESKFHPEATDRARAARLLARRGFEEDDIGTALDRFFGESPSPNGEF